MLPTCFRKQLPAIMLLFVLLSAFNTMVFAKTDTTYLYVFEFRNIPIQLNLKQKVDRFEISLLANKLEATIDSSHVAKGGSALLKITGFESSASNSDTLNLPLEFTLTEFNRALRMLMVSHTTTTDVRGPDLLELYSHDVPLTEALAAVFQKVKADHLGVNFQQKTQAVETEKKVEIEKINKAHNETIDSLLNIIDVIDEENRFGGQFEMVDKDSLGISVYHTSSYNNGRYAAYSRDSILFYPNSILVRTFNNFIDLLHVDGNVKIDGQTIPVTFYNGDFSIPLKHIYQRRQYLAFRIPDVNKNYLTPDFKRERKNWKADSASKKTSSSGPDSLRYALTGYKTYLVNVSDLIRVNHYKKHMTFMIKNDAYLLTHKDSIVPYERRSFYDYLSFTTFMDFLGVVEKTPNSLIQVEGRIRLPLRLISTKLGLFKKNSYIYSNVFFPKIDAYLNAAFINGSQSDNRVTTILNQSSNTADLDTLYIDNFDLVRKNNIRTGIELGIIKHEMKSYNTNFYIDYGIHFFRTNLQYTIVNSGDLDEQVRYNVWSWTHGPIARFEYRPDQNLGMDISFAVNFNQHILNSDNDNLKVFEVKGPINKNTPTISGAVPDLSNYQRNNYKLEFNAYFMVNPTRSNGGLYFRLSNYFNYNFSQIFPQVLIGYSTRLSGMIKNIKNKADAND